MLDPSEGHVGEACAVANHRAQESLADSVVLFEDGHLDVEGCDGFDDDSSLCGCSPNTFLPDNRAECFSKKVDLNGVRIHFNNYISLKLTSLFAAKSSQLVLATSFLFPYQAVSLGNTSSVEGLLFLKADYCCGRGSPTQVGEQR